MLTWRIHRTLDDPLKREPIIWGGYERLLAIFEPIKRRGRRHINETLMLAALVVIGAPFASLGVIVIFLPSPVLALILTISYGLLTVTRVSSRIAAEHQRRTYELLCALPYGRIGVHWLYAAHWYRQSLTLRSVTRAMMALGIGASPFLFGGFAYPLTGQRAVQFWFIDSLSFGVYLLYDYFNTRVIATLIGMIVPAITRSPRTIRALALGVFLLFLVSVYGVGTLIALALLPGLLLRINAPMLAYIVIAPLTAAGMIALREALTRLLWRQIERGMQVSALEIDTLIR